MRAVDIIRVKRDGGELSRAEIDVMVRGATDGSVPPYQLSAWLMAVWLRGMTPAETAALTEAMVASGVTVDLSALPGHKIDKHSTGGVGDKTSLVIAPMVAACGVVVPMMSGRGLGHTGGTLDKLESIPGFRTRLTLDEFRAQLADIGCALIGQTDDVAPADRTLYALRDVTATVESRPLICASILSKKIAEGIDGLVLDVKTGAGAFLPDEDDARALADALVGLAEASGLTAAALLTTMDAPLGRGVGNALEVRECLEVLRGGGPDDLVTLCVELAAVMLRLGERAASLDEARTRARVTLQDGTALAVFRAIVERQGGDVRVIDDPSRLPAAPRVDVVTAPADGYVTQLHAGLLGRASTQLGAGRARVEDDVDPAVGLVVRAPLGAAVTAGQPILDVHSRDDASRAAAWPLIEQAVHVGATPPHIRPLVLDRLGAALS
jgi:pyrimidine-nucleoside phosphorylase